MRAVVELQRCRWRRYGVPVTFDETLAAMHEVLGEQSTSE
jgi:hypothetical protein